MGFKELCQVLGIPEQEQELGVLGGSGQPGGLHTFLSSPTSNSKRCVSVCVRMHAAPPGVQHLSVGTARELKVALMVILDFILLPPSNQETQ